MHHSTIFVCCICFGFVLVSAGENTSVVFRDRSKANRNVPKQQEQKEPTQIFHKSRSIPLDMIMKLNSVSNENDFVKQFLEPDPLESLAPSTNSEKGQSFRRVSRLTDSRQVTRDTEIEVPQIATAYSSSGASLGGNNRLSDGVAGLGGLGRFGGNEPAVENRNDKKNGPPIPRSANCQPELRTVTLKDDDDPTMFYYPSCTRVDRCGGCCSHDLLSCQPIAVEYKNFSVYVSEYTGGSKLELRGKKVVTVETHTKCKCDCKVKPKDCNALQEYKKGECRCICMNRDEEARCPSGNMKLWDPTTCSCRCREVRECSTGLIFDENTCSCTSTNKQYPPSFNLDRDRYNV